MRGAQRLLAIPLLVLPTAVLPGCQMNERTTATIAGAAGGALLAAAISGSAGAILLGAAGGGLLGYVVGDYLCDCRTGGGGGCGVPSPCEVPASPCAVPCAPAADSATASAAAPPASGPARAAYERGRAAATTSAARSAYEESIRLDPTRAEPWNALAVQSLVAGDRAKARTQLARALELDPAYAPARYNLERLDREP